MKSSGNGRIVVTGCLGAEPVFIPGAHPRVPEITGPLHYEVVLEALRAAVPVAPIPSSISALPSRSA